MRPDNLEGAGACADKAGEAHATRNFRVLQIVNSPEPGGVLSLSNSIAEGLRRHGYEVETAFITPRVGMSLLEKARGCLATARRIASGRHGAVIAYQGAGAITAALTGLGLGSPILIAHQTTQPDATSRPVRVIDRLLGSLGLYQVNVVNSVSTRSHFDTYPESYRDRLVLIEHGVAPPATALSREEVLERYGLPLTAPILLNTGRLVTQKNQGVLIEALAEIPGAHLVIAGGGDLGEAYDILARERGVADRLHMLGALPYEETIELYGAADLFVFPSIHETFGISGVEAVMVGMPALVSEIPVLREVLTCDGQTEVGFIPPHDSRAWARAINNRLCNPASRAALDRFAERIRWKYSEDRMIGGYLVLLAGPASSAG